MKKTGLALALLAMMGLANNALAQQQQPRTAKVAPCVGMKSDGVAAQVKRDFLQNRIISWDADKKVLGSDSVAWVSPTAITGKDDVWQVPLTVRGSKAQKTYDVTLDCQKGEITYNGPQ